MQQPDQPTLKTKPGFGKQKQLSLRIDMTPMVDLGFLLISFFVITTSLAEPRALNLIVPKPGPPMPVKESASLTFLAASGNKLFYYSGSGQSDLQEKMKTISNNSREIGEVIAVKRDELYKMGKDPNELFVMIKPAPGSKYKMVVDLLDEMIIHNVSRYALVSPETAELSLLNKH